MKRSHFLFSCRPPAWQGQRASASSLREKKKRGRREERLSSLAFSLRPSLFLSVSVHQIMKMSRNQWPHSFHCLFRRGWDDTYWILINKKRDTECACVCVGGQNKTQHTLAEEPLHPPLSFPYLHACLVGEKKKERQEIENSPPKLKQRHCRLNTRSNLLFILSKQWAVNT